MIHVPTLVRHLLEGAGIAEPRIHRTVQALVAQRGLLRDGADAFARSVGFGSRHQLHHLLRHHQVPSLTAFAGSIRVLTVAIELHEHGVSLEYIAWRDGVDPSVEYRRARRILGATLGAALQEGIEGVLVRVWQQWAWSLASRSGGVPVRGAVARALLAAGESR